jgi:hypothetical protein
VEVDLWKVQQMTKEAKERTMNLSRNDVRTEVTNCERLASQQI